MNINFELYKVFYNVAKNGNITRTAKELCISQPGISKAIKNLESQLDCSLFIRSKSGVILTEEGKVFYEQIKQAMEIVDGAEQKIMEMVNLDYGYLSIGVSNTLTKKYLLPYIEKFHEKYPKIKIKIFTNPTFELITKARNGLIDFMILNLPCDIPHDFHKEELLEVQDCFVTSNKFKELKDRIIPLNELNNYPLILIAKGANTRYFLDNFCNDIGVNLVSEMELGSYSLVTEFTKIGFGIGIATKEFLNNELNDGTLFEVKTTPLLPSRFVGISYLKNKMLSRCSLKFIEMLKNKEE